MHRAGEATEPAAGPDRGAGNAAQVSGRGLGLRTGLALILGTVLAVLLVTSALPHRGDVIAVQGSSVVASIAAGLCCLWRSRRAADPWPWRLLALAAFFTTIGNILTVAARGIQKDESATLGAGEVPFILGYLLLVAAFARLFPPSTRPGAIARRVVDIAVITTILSAIAWIGLLRHVADHAPMGDAVTLAIYPAIDLAVCAALLIFASEVGGAQRKRLVVMAMGVALFFVGDANVALLAAQDLVDHGSPYAMAWTAGYFAFALAALARPAAPDPPMAVAPNTRLASGLVYGPLAAFLPLAVVDYVRTSRIDPVLFLLGTLMVVALAARQLLLSRELLASNRRLQDSEAQRSAVLAAIPDLVFVFDADRRFSQFFAGGGQRPHLPPERFIGRRATDALPPEVGRMVDDAAARTMATRATHEIQYTLPSPAGLQHFEARLAAMPDGGVVGLARDVTPRVHAVEEAERRQARLEEAQAMANLGSWDWDVGADRSVMSPEMHRILGSPGPAGAGDVGSLAGFLDRLVPEDKAPMSAAVKATLDEGLPLDRVVRYVRPDGEARHLHVRGVVVRDADGRPARLIGTTQDITRSVAASQALRESEERFQLASQATRDVIWDWDLVRQRLLYSPALRTVFGHDPAAFAKPGLFMSLVHPDDLADLGARMGALLEGDETQLTADYRLRHADGSYRDVVDRVLILRDAAGNPLRFVGAMQDVTDQRRQQARLVAKEAEAVRLQEVAAFKTQFLNSAAHELATPLTPIRLQMASLRRSIFGELTPKQAEAIGLLDRNLERLNLLVQDLLDAARLQGGHLKVQAKPVALGPLMADTLASFAEKARQEGVNLAARGLDSSVELLGDEPRLTQVLVNLVHNAFKFTPRGGSIGLEAGTEGGHAILAVRDSGSGLAPEQVARLFQPFTQVHDVAKHNVGGTGLGLYICKGIVEQHGGVLSCRSDGPGKGCTFEIRIPLRPATPIVPAASQASGDAGAR